MICMHILMNLYTGPDTAGPCETCADDKYCFSAVFHWIPCV